MAVSDPVLLGCGRSMDAVLAGADEPPDAHEEGCPYCGEARAGVRRLEMVSAELRAEYATDPDAVPSDKVKRSVMDIARMEVRRGRTLSLRRVGGVPDPDLTVSEQVVAGVIRATSDRTPGVHARRCTVRLAQSAAESGPVQLDVGLTLAVASTVAIPSALTTLRRQIATAVREATGVEPSRVDVTVEDLFDV